MARLIRLTIAAFAASTLLFSGSVAAEHKNVKKTTPFEEAELYIEYQHTDKDLGLHGLIDGKAWKKLKIWGPDLYELLDVDVQGRLGKQGLTELFFESDEKELDELSAKEFFKRFPEGYYLIKGLTLDYKLLKSFVKLTHLLPAPAKVTVNGKPMAIQCDEDEYGYDITHVYEPVTLAWEPVKWSHPFKYGASPEPVYIRSYEVVVEAELEVYGKEFTSVLSVLLPPDQTWFTLPEDFTSLADRFKFEVIAREKSGNQTIVESCFKIIAHSPPPDPAPPPHKHKHKHKHKHH